MCDKSEMDLLTVIEASEILRLKPSTVRSWLLKRRIPFVKLGSRVFIRKNDCIQLIQKNIVNPSIPIKNNHGDGLTLHAKLVKFLGEEFRRVSGEVGDS
jgi:excisionase family DNA binding protein